MAHLFKTVVDLSQKNREVIWDTLATVGDKNAHTFAIGLRLDNRSVDLTNARVQLLVRRADKKDRIITGSVSDDNYAVATLDEYCYEITGRIRCTLLISVNGATLTGVRATLTVEDGLGNVVIDPAGEIPNLQDLLAEIDGMRQATAAANTAANNANDAAAMIEQIRAGIESAVNEAKEAVEEAETAVSEATTAIKEAQKITTGWANAQTEAESVPSDSPAEVNMGLDDEGNRILIFKIPKGQNGINPHIGANGHWFVGNVDTGIKAKGDTGDDGITPHIGTNGNWFVGSADTGVRAQGPQGAPGTGSGTVTGVVLNGQTYVPNNLGVIELPELGGSDVELSYSIPSALGQNASAGTGSKAAREDHVHKMPSASDTGALGKNEKAVDSAKLAGKEPSHYENKITAITANGQAVQPDANGAVNLGTIGRSNLEIDDTSVSAEKVYSSQKIQQEFNQLSGKSGLPAGGSTGQMIVKKSDADGDVAWSNVPSDDVYNYLHNCNFRKWVAQAGINAQHEMPGDSISSSIAVFSGDRWMWMHGEGNTIEADPCADGYGYTNVRLNGTIKQVVAGTPTDVTPVVTVLSGEASITYENGVCEITGNNAVLDTAYLVKSGVPRRRSYEEELAICHRYFYRYAAGESENPMSILFFGTATAARTFVYLPQRMRVNPYIKSVNMRVIAYAGNATGFTIKTITGARSPQGNALTMSITITGTTTVGTPGTFAPIKGSTDAHIEFSADIKVGEDQSADSVYPDSGGI